MTTDPTLQTLTTLAIEAFGPAIPPLTPETIFQQIPGFDSVRAVQFILAVESHFQIILTESEVDSMHKVADLLQTLSTKP